MACLLGLIIAFVLSASTAVEDHCAAMLLSQAVMPFLRTGGEKGQGTPPPLGGGQQPLDTAAGGGGERGGAGRVSRMTGAGFTLPSSYLPYLPCSPRTPNKVRRAVAVSYL